MESLREDTGCCDCSTLFSDDSITPRRTPVKIEPKVYFANERTFLKWVNVAVTIASFAVGILAFSGDAAHEKEARAYALVLLPIATLVMLYGLYRHLVRIRMIRNREPGPYDDTYGPVCLVVILCLVFTVDFIVNFAEASE